MSYAVQFAPSAAQDLQRLFDFLAEPDAKAARGPRLAIAKGIEFLRDFPFSCRKASPEHPGIDYQFWREWVRRVI